MSRSAARARVTGDGDERESGDALVQAGANPQGVCEAARLAPEKVSGQIECWRAGDGEKTLGAGSMRAAPRGSSAE